MVHTEIKDRHSLADAYRTVPVAGKSWLRRMLSFVGPGYLVSVGYMDPGNWATDLEGGSQFGYRLLWVILASNLMAMILQTLCARLGIGAGKDLAQACRAYYKKPAAVALWILCEIAIIACDIAEVIGSAVALNLLFQIPLTWGVLITGFDVLILLGLMKFGFRKLEAIVIVLVATIFLCFGINIWWSNPHWGQVAHGLFVPSIPGKEALLISVGILGATVMPHNLYLHSSIVQTRAFDQTEDGKKKAAKMATIDVVIALGAAFFVNAAILIVSAAVFYGTGQVVDGLDQAHELLRPALGGAAATLFAVALLCSGQSSTITGTLAGQIVMEGFLDIRMAPWLRRMITRGLAIIPAVLLISMSGGHGTMRMLTISQVVLSMQLPFAIFPLVMITADRRRMGNLTNPLWLTVVGSVICLLITALNINLLCQDEFLGWRWVVGIGAVMLAFGLWVSFGYRGKPQET
ncbi:MAG TPA: Nramp family divalent metal transporter, partial [Fimbriimonadaceae bacterium]|nr:Nramp family divalent metal transporter [Fimbriimonadaceae bacterium]